MITLRLNYYYKEALSRHVTLKTVGEDVDVVDDHGTVMTSVQSADGLCNFLVELASGKYGRHLTLQELLPEDI
jgi:hypothetical protein